jgi:hypothetical protein
MKVKDQRICEEAELLFVLGLTVFRTGNLEDFERGKVFVS